jgi:putative phosphoesterase
MKLLFISDIHANMEALKAVLETVKYDHVFCTGDLVDYGPDPLGCIGWIRDNNVLTIRGNHDNAVALHVDCGCGYIYKHLSEATREYTWAHISDNDEKFLRGLPTKHELEIDGIKFMLAHGSPASFFDYINPDISLEKLDEYTAGVAADFLVVGHTHKPVVLRSSNTTVLNPGSVGQPRDKDWRASCMVFDTDSRTPEIIRLDYDMEATCNKIRSSMPNADELIAILKRGY